MMLLLFLFKSSLKISPINVPHFKSFELLDSLFMPITWIKLGLLFNNIMGQPEE